MKNPFKPASLEWAVFEVCVVQGFGFENVNQLCHFFNFYEDGTPMKNSIDEGIVQPISAIQMKQVVEDIQKRMSRVKSLCQKKEEVNPYKEWNDKGMIRIPDHMRVNQ